jgi:N-acyl homoserine lactone hydrolase
MSAVALCRAVLVALAALPLPGPAAAKGPSPATVDLMYVLDCGSATSPDFSQWSPGSNQGRPVVMSDPCYLIKHGSDWLMWDTGVDDRLAGLPRGREVAHKVRGIVGPTVTRQLVELKVRPDDISIIAFSHAHFDHVGNARLFRRARWLVQRQEHAAMFGNNPEAYGFLPGLYATMRRNPTTLLDGDHDVFGDASVTIIATPGHTPGHQSLLVRLPGVGPVLLSGDIAHSLENFEQRRVPNFNADPIATKRSIEMVDELLRREHAELWLGHDRRQMEAIMARAGQFGRR